MELDSLVNLFVYIVAIPDPVANVHKVTMCSCSGVRTVTVDSRRDRKMIHTKLSERDWNQRT